MELKITVRVEVESPSEATFIRHKIEATVAEHQKLRVRDYIVNEPHKSSKSIEQIRNPPVQYLGEEQ